MMNNISRRTVLAGSLVAVATLRQPALAMAATQCATGSLPGFLPSRLTVDCASRRNFQLFRQNPAYLGLAGAVSMTFVRGKIGSYPAGNLFLFPWLKPKGRALGATKVWSSVAPVDATQYVPASPIPSATLPLDEYFCRIVLQAPWPYFIGFGVDEPFDKAQPKLAWFSNVDKLADGKGVGIEWSSANLNRPWFGGSGYIPATDDCNGSAWRQIIVDGLNQAATPAC
jgi:hypothetical protein